MAWNSNSRLAFEALNLQQMHKMMKLLHRFLPNNVSPIPQVAVLFIEGHIKESVVVPVPQNLKDAVEERGRFLHEQSSVRSFQLNVNMPVPQVVVVAPVRQSFELFAEVT